MRALWLGFFAFAACSPTTDGDHVEPEGARGLLVLRVDEDVVRSVYGIEIGEAEEGAVWVPAEDTPGETVVLRYTCSLAQLGLPTGPIAIAAEGRRLPEHEEIDVRVVAPLPPCRPVDVIRTALDAPATWLSTDGVRVLVGHDGGRASRVDASGGVEALELGPNLYAIGVGGSIATFRSNGVVGTTRTTTIATPSPWMRWLTGTSTRGNARLLTDHGARIHFDGDVVEVEEAATGEALGRAMTVASGDDVWWFAAADRDTIVAIADDGSEQAVVDAPPGRVHAVAEASGMLVVGTSRGEVFVRRDGAWARATALGEEVRAITSAGESAVVLGVAGAVAVIDPVVGRVCYAGRLATAAGANARAVGRRVVTVPSSTPATLWQVGLADGRACPEAGGFAADVSP